MDLLYKPLVTLWPTGLLHCGGLTYCCWYGSSAIGPITNGCLNCVAIPEIVRGPWSHNCARSLCGWHGRETWRSWTIMNDHGQNWDCPWMPPKAALGNVSHWPAMVFSGGCVPWTSDHRGDWLVLAADVTAGCGVRSLEISEFSDSGLSILLSLIPFGLLESVNLFVWVFLDRFYTNFSGLSSSRSLTSWAKNEAKVCALLYGQCWKVCWLSMIPEWNQAKYTVICEACRDMEVLFNFD